MNKELIEALDSLEREKKISKASLLEVIETSLLSACKNHFGTSDNIRVNIDPVSCDYSVVREREVVDSLDGLKTDELSTKISLADAKKINVKYELGDKVLVEVKSAEFGRIATGIAKNVILQKIREEERKAIYYDYFSKEKDILTGIVQRQVGKNISINLGRCDATLSEYEQVKNEELKPTDRIKVYVLEVKDTPKGPKIQVSRSSQELVKRLFEYEVLEIREGIVEIKAIAREAGSRTKIAVHSYDENVDAVGACVGLNGIRVNAVVDELRGEKVDIISWDSNPANLIENALSPAKVIAVLVAEDEKEATVIVPDYQLSLAIGKEGQNARLAAKLTGFKIDIKSETQAMDSGLFELYGISNMSEGNFDLISEEADTAYENEPEEDESEEEAMLEDEIDEEVEETL